ncbi:methyltransferase [Anaeromyxobacter sp. Red801]|uniref:methyltransferase n=1 Tax=Anaeromyxobacter sp. Red801 TaxID=3411632 RepID=UPI003BA22237
MTRTDPTAAAPPRELVWRDATGEHRARWASGSAPPPARLGPAGDATRAGEALARARRGEGLVYAGDYHNARQLLAAMGRRLEHPAPKGAGLAGAYRAARERMRLEHEVLARLLVPVEPGWRIALRRAPEVAAACAEALGPPPDGPALLPLRELLGLVAAHEWRRRGVEVPALGARVHPFHGVYAPIRGEYVDLVAAAAAERSLEGTRAFDLGTGTGVLALVLARAGARVIATDLEPRAVACARENAARLGLAGRVEVVEADLFPEGVADVIVCNPPWIPGAAHGPLERAVYDPGGAFLERLVRGLPAHLAPGGEAWIVLSDLAERLGLRPAGEVARLAGAAGLEVADVREARPSHPRARDRADPLHAARAAEVTRLFRLRRRR